MKKTFVKTLYDSTSKYKKPKLTQQVTTLWEYPSQHYGAGMQGSKYYKGATPSYVIWNFLMKFTTEDDLIVDPMCGSGTTIDVCKDISRKVLGFDLVPFREDIKQSDARHLPLKNNSVDAIFVDPPYSDHIDYSDHGKCIGKTKAKDGSYYTEMKKVINELHRVLKSGGHMALYISDSAKKNAPFEPLGFRIFHMMEQQGLQAVDVISVVRHNRTLKMGNYRKAADEGGFYLRGFNYLFIMKKP